MFTCSFQNTALQSLTLSHRWLESSYTGENATSFATVDRERQYSNPANVDPVILLSLCTERYHREKTNLPIIKKLWMGYRTPTSFWWRSLFSGCYTILIAWYNSFDTITMVESACFVFGWCLGSYLTPGPLRLKWWHRPLDAYQGNPAVPQMTMLAPNDRVLTTKLYMSSFTVLLVIESLYDVIGSDQNGRRKVTKYRGILSANTGCVSADIASLYNMVSHQVHRYTGYNRLQQWKIDLLKKKTQSWGCGLQIF